MNKFFQDILDSLPIARKGKKVTPNKPIEKVFETRQQAGPYLYGWNIPEGADRAILNTTKALSDGESDFFTYRSPNGKTRNPITPLIHDLLLVPGMTVLEVSRYHIVFHKANLFKWEDILPAIEVAIRTDLERQES